MELNDVEVDGCRDRLDLVDLWIDEHADQLRVAGRPRDRRDHQCALGREVALRLRPEVKADEVGTARRNACCIVGECDAADLDPRHRSSSRSAAPGDGARIRCSPTRIAWAPASASMRTSAGLLMPLSPTSTVVGGTTFATFSVSVMSIVN